MKKFIFFGFMLIILASCEEEKIYENSNEETYLVEENVQQLTYNIDGEDIFVDVTIVDGEFSVVQNDNSKRLQEMFDSDEFVTYVDSNEEPPLLFTSIGKYEEFIVDEVRFTARREALGRHQVLNNLKEKSSKNGTPSFTIGRNNTPEVTIPVNTRYSNRHLGFNKCITGGISFQDNISYVDVGYGLKVRFYVRDDYRGNVLILDATEAVEGIGYNDLHDIRRRRSVTIDDQIDWSYNFCGIFCSSWNDVFSSISATEPGVNEFTNRNTRNVCGGSGSGGSGGGGENPINPK